MKKILVIESSPRGDQSVSRKLTREIVTKLRAKYPDSEVNTRDLSVTPFPHIQEDEIKAFFTPADQRDVGQKKIIELSEEAVNEFLASDIIVIGAPVWNF